MNWVFIAHCALAGWSHATQANETIAKSIAPEKRANAFFSSLFFIHSQWTRTACVFLITSHGSQESLTDTGVDTMFNYRFLAHTKMIWFRKKQLLIFYRLPEISWFDRISCEHFLCNLHTIHFRCHLIAFFFSLGRELTTVHLKSNKYEYKMQIDAWLSSLKSKSIARSIRWLIGFSIRAIHSTGWNVNDESR